MELCSNVPIRLGRGDPSTPASSNGKSNGKTPHRVEWNLEKVIGVPRGFGPGSPGSQNVIGNVIGNVIENVIGHAFFSPSLKVNHYWIFLWLFLSWSTCSP